jgi:ubiquitin carboxyl-terminal hydrolase 5/13
VEAGGNGHAITHFEATGHSVVLKLGTVTPKGADLYCYACDTEVKDPKLADHLAFFGINMDSATKTAKSLGEMAYDLTMQHDYKAICDVGEDGKSTLKPAFGANALTGMHNFGNTCYLASAMQVLISTSPDFRRAFLDGKHIQGCTSKAPRDCFGCQLEKFATAVYSDRFSRTSVQIANSYDTSRGISVQSASAQELAFKRFESAVAEELKALSNTNAEGRKPLCVTLKSSSRPRQAKLSSDIVNGVTPRDLKRVLANGRSDFLSGDQQDAQEFIAHVLALSRAKVVGTGATRTAGGKSEREDDAHVNGGRIDPSHSSRIEVVARKECLGCQRVAYARNLEDTIRLSNPIDPSSLPAPPANKDDPEPPRPSVALQEVFERFVSPSMVEGARCEDCSARDGFITTNCLANLPEVLVFDVNRQYFDVNTLSTKKMNVLVMPPQSVDLSFLKGPNGPQPGEQTLSSHSNIVRATTDAIYADVPPTATSTATTASAAPAAVVSVDEMSLVQMISMGIDQPVAEWALRKTKNNLEQAIDAVFSGAAPSVEELLMQSTAPPPPPATPALIPPNPSATADSGNDDGSVTLSDVAHGGNTTYHLSAMISHVGSSAQTGHYVCHIRKPKSSVTSEAFDSADSGDDDHCWVSYNDEKVGVTTKPPFGQASTYVYRRTS